MGAIYDPKANTWTVLSPPSTSSPNQFQCIGDAPATLLADGRLIIGSKLYQSLAILDPTTLSWSIVSATGKTDAFNAEEGWTLLPDGSFFTLDVKNAPASERFLHDGPDERRVGILRKYTSRPSTRRNQARLPCQAAPLTIRRAKSGQPFCFLMARSSQSGRMANTGIYTPPAAGSTATGSWAVGPQLPAGLNVEDGPGAILPSGHVLFGASPGETGTGLQYFEFDGTNLISIPLPAKPPAM